MIWVALLVIGGVIVVYTIVSLLNVFKTLQSHRLKFANEFFDNILQLTEGEQVPERLLSVLHALADDLDDPHAVDILLHVVMNNIRHKENVDAGELASLIEGLPESERELFLKTVLSALLAISYQKFWKGGLFRASMGLDSEKKTPDSHEAAEKVKPIYDEWKAEQAIAAA